MLQDIGHLTIVHDFLVPTCSTPGSRKSKSNALASRTVKSNELFLCRFSLSTFTAWQKSIGRSSAFECAVCRTVPLLCKLFAFARTKECEVGTMDKDRAAFPGSPNRKIKAVIVTSFSSSIKFLVDYKLACMSLQLLNPRNLLQSSFAPGEQTSAHLHSISLLALKGLSG
ncbi:hypothetical protein MTO96_007471 [Rhipicephalus appendiculatus]